MKIANKFAHNISKTHLIQDFHPEILDLSKVAQWPNHSGELDLIYTQFTSNLLEVDTKCTVPTDNHWSFDLKNRFSTYTYWKIIIRRLKSHKPVSVQLQKIKDQINLYDIHQASTSISVIKQLGLSRKELIDSRNNTYQNRQQIFDHIQCKQNGEEQTT